MKSSLFRPLAPVRSHAELHGSQGQINKFGGLAATALVHGMTVVIRHTSNFAATGVVLLNPWEIGI